MFITNGFQKVFSNKTCSLDFKTTHFQPGRTLLIENRIRNFEKKIWKFKNFEIFFKTKLVMIALPEKNQAIKK